MTPANPERWWRGRVLRAVRLYFAPFVRVDPVADKEAGPFAQRFIRWALAVTILVGVGIGIAQHLSPAPVTIALVTGANEWDSKLLPEGSKLQARPDSNLIARLYAQERRVDVMRGEALFDVAHESSRPFIVYAGKTQTRAVGTQFSVAHPASGEVKVSVLEGEVLFTNISSNGTRTQRSLTAGMGASVSNGEVSAFHIASYDDIRRAYWEGNTLHMGRATMGEVVAVLNVHESQRIVIDDPRVAATRWPSSAFVAEYSLDRFLSQIEATQPAIAVHRQDGVVHLTAKTSR